MHAALKSLLDLDLKLAEKAQVKSKDDKLMFDILNLVGEENFKRVFRSLVYGNDSDDVATSGVKNGTEFWVKQVSQYSSECETLKDLYSQSLDEKRNFFTFALTLFTIVLAPLAVLTGYFGMNFDNMQELNSATYDQYGYPGVKLLWVILGIVYGIIFVTMFHFRLIHYAL